MASALVLIILFVGINLFKGFVNSGYTRTTRGFDCPCPEDKIIFYDDDETVHYKWSDR